MKKQVRTTLVSIGLLAIWTSALYALDTDAGMKMVQKAVNAIAPFMGGDKQAAENTAKSIATKNPVVGGLAASTPSRTAEPNMDEHPAPPSKAELDKAAPKAAPPQQSNLIERNITPAHENAQHDVGGHGDHGGGGWAGPDHGSSHIADIASR